MPKGPRGEKRPADVIGMSVKVMRIATGEEEEELDRAKSAAAELGARGGKARAATMSPERRAEVAKKAASWSMACGPYAMHLPSGDSGPTNAPPRDRGPTPSNAL